MSQMQQMREDLVMVVDENDQVLGSASKLDAHRNRPEQGEEPKLHRAFSLFLFNKKGELLLQQRSTDKLTFPNIWANTCCSHPAPGEKTISAAIRRAASELNIKIGSENGLAVVGRFLYRADWGAWTEHELDHVVFGFFDQNGIEFNNDEVQAVKWISAEEFERELATHGDQYSPWLHKIWSQYLKASWAAWINDRSVEYDPEIHKL